MPQKWIDVEPQQPIWEDVPSSKYRPVEEQPGFWGGVVGVPQEIFESVDRTGKTAYKQLTEGNYPGAFGTLVDPFWQGFQGLTGMISNKAQGKPIVPEMTSQEAGTEGLAQIAGAVGFPTEGFKEAYATSNYPRLAGQAVGAAATLGLMKGAKKVGNYRVRLEREPIAGPINTDPTGYTQPDLPFGRPEPTQEPLIPHPVDKYDELADLGVRTPDQMTELDALRQQLGVDQKPPYKPGIDPFTNRFRKIPKEEPTQQSLDLTPSEGPGGQMEMFNMDPTRPSVEPPPTAGPTAAPPTGPGELPRVVTLKSPDAAQVAMYRNQGYVSVPGLRSPEGYVQMVRGDIAGMYTKAEKPGPVTPPTPKQTVRGPFAEGEAPAGDTITVPNEKVTPTFISNMEKGGYKVAGKDTATTKFKKFLASEEGSYDPEWAKKFFKQRKPDWSERPKIQPLQGGEEIPELAFQPDEGISTEREFSEHFLPDEEGKVTNPITPEEINTETNIAPEGRMNEIITHYPSIYNEALTIYNETNPEGIVQNLAKYVMEEKEIWHKFNEAQSNRLKHNIPEPPELKAAYNRAFRLKGLAQAKYERAYTRIVGGKAETIGKFLQGFWHSEEGSFDPDAIIQKLRELLGRAPTEPEIQREAFQGGMGARPGEETGRVAPFDRGWIPEENQPPPVSPEKLQGFLDNAPWKSEYDRPYNPADHGQPWYWKYGAGMLSDWPPTSLESIIRDIPSKDLEIRLNQSANRTEYNSIINELQRRQSTPYGEHEPYTSDQISEMESRSRFPGMSDAQRYSPEMSAWRQRQLEPTQQNLPMPMPVTPELQRQSRLEAIGDISPEEHQLPLDFSLQERAPQLVNPLRPEIPPDQLTNQRILDLSAERARENQAAQQPPEQLYQGGHEFQPDITQTNEPVPETGGESPQFDLPTDEAPSADVPGDRSFLNRVWDFILDDRGHFDWDEFRKQWAEMFPDDPMPFSRSNQDATYQQLAGFAKELGIDPRKFETIEELRDAIDTAGEQRFQRTGSELPKQNPDRRSVLSEPSKYNEFEPTEDEPAFITKQRRTLEALTVLEQEIHKRGGTVPLGILKKANDAFEKIVEYDNTRLAMPEPETVNPTAWERFLKGEEGSFDPSKLSWENIKEKTGWGLGRAAKMKPGEFNFIKEALAVPSAATTTLDFSAPGRQGLSMILTPQFWKASVKMFQGVTENGFRMIDEDLNNKSIMRKKINLETGEVGKSVAEEIGLKTFRPASEVGPRAEAVASRWLETGGSIPYFSKAYKNTVGVPIRATNRAFITFLNHLNVNRTEFLMNKARDMAVKAIETGEARPGFLKKKFSPEEAMDLNPYHNMVLGKEIADFVNTATGHGPLRTHLLPYKGAELNLERAAGALNGTLFSPGLLFSRIRMLNPNTYVMASPFVRKQYVKAALSTAAAWFAYTQLAKMADPEAEVSNDITSADFGKVRIGNTRFDPGGGFLQFLVAYGRLYNGGATSSASGEFHRFGSGYQAQTQEDMMERFFVNKLNPVAKFAYDLGNASEYNPFHVGDRTMQLFVPLIVQDINELAQEDPSLLPWMVPVALGGGTQTYSKGESVSKFLNPENDWLATGGGLRDLMPWNQQ